MESSGKARPDLWGIALAGLMVTGVMAADEPGWQGEAGAHGASLYYGIPQSDYAPVSFSCTPDGDGLSFALAFTPGAAEDGAEIEVLLQAGDIMVPLQATGFYVEMDDSFVLEGRTVLDARLADLLTARGTLMVFVEDGAEEYPLDGAREAAAPLLKTCAGQATAAIAPLCHIGAWSADTDPDGTNVRAGPGTDYPVIGRLPSLQETDDDFAAEVSIVGAQDGWFRIEQATINNYGSETGPDVVFAGEGWVSGRLLGLSMEGSALFAQPSRHAPMVLDLDDAPERRQGPDYIGPQVERLYACMGNWVEVEVSDLGQHYRGWTDDTCANQVTTCP